MEVRSGVNEHYLSRKSNFSHISHAFTEGLKADARIAEAGGGGRAEKFMKRQSQPCFGVSGDRSTLGQVSLGAVGVVCLRLPGWAGLKRESLAGRDWILMS